MTTLVLVYKARFLVFFSRHCAVVNGVPPQGTPSPLSSNLILRSKLNLSILAILNVY
jgi:hypothetical protein